MIILQKAKPLGLGNKYGTRKSRQCIKGNKILPRSDGTWYRQCDTTRSKRRKFLKKLSNKKIRNYKFDISSGCNYKRVFDLPRTLD